MVVLVPTELKIAVSKFVGSMLEPGPVVLVPGFQFAAVDHWESDAAFQV
jgi:hypothetical protein